nr:TraB/GumN family protein [Polymorphobacter sp.]
MRVLFWALALLLAAPVAAAPAMWVVRDGDTEITMFGTVHALPKGETWLTPAVTARFDAADSLVLETVIPDDPFALAPMLADIGLRPGLKPLAARVSAEVAPRLAPAAAAAGLPLVALDRMETWLAAITLSEATLRSMGIASDAGVEPAFMARARGTKKSIVGLETPEQQLRYLDGLPEADQVAMLEATLDDLKVAREDTERLIALWRAGDVETIAQEFAKEAKASALLTKVLLTDRNARWAEWISGVMKRPGKVFLAVGAGHFGGPDGLLALLKARGLTPERVESGTVLAMP